MTFDNPLIGLASIIVLGTVAQWLAWRLRLPSILLLLLSGFVVGPVTGLLDPTTLLGDLLFPIVSLSVAIILFEGGLSLDFSELGSVRQGCSSSHQRRRSRHLVSQRHCRPFSPQPGCIHRTAAGCDSHRHRPHGGHPVTAPRSSHRQGQFCLEVGRHPHRPGWCDTGRAGLRGHYCRPSCGGTAPDHSARCSPNTADRHRHRDSGCCRHLFSIARATGYPIRFKTRCR